MAVSGASAKTGMKELFAEAKVKKDGTLSKVWLQISAQRSSAWARLAA
jgi:hypothetical protein